MSAINATLTRKSDSTSVSVPLYKVHAAFKFSGAVRPEDDIIKIDSVDYVLSSLSIEGVQAGGTVASLGTVAFGEVNAAAAAAEPIIKTFAAAIPATKRLAGFFVKCTQEFVNAGADIDALIIDPATSANTNFSGGTLTLNAEIFRDSGGEFIKGAAPADVEVRMTFAGGVVNPQDFTAGSVTVYALLADWPTLS